MEDAYKIKKLIAAKALEFIYPDMKVGLGSGSTAFEFIKLLGDSGLKVEAIAASLESEKLALKHNIIINPHLPHCDIYIDGTDEFDDDRNCLKGKGGALFREKIIASMSKQVIILAEASKKSTKLNRSPLVCEILPFGHAATIKHIEQLGFKGALRNDMGKPILTDNGAFLFDIALLQPIQDPAALHRSLKSIPGILETGLFFNMVNKIIIGLKEGQVMIYE